MTRPLFVDTGAFYARADSDDDHHEAAVRLFGAIRSGDRQYRPLYSSQAVLSELATLCLYRLGHDVATRTLTAIRESDVFRILPIDRSIFAAAAERFDTYDDQEISFVDQTTAVIADERDVQHLFGFDDDFQTLGFTLVPSG